MPKYLCHQCKRVYEEADAGKCPHCGAPVDDRIEFTNSDEFLKPETPGIIAEREASGLEGLVGGLAAVIINTEVNRQKAAAAELVRYTGYRFDAAFEGENFRSCVLKCPGSADFLIRSRSAAENPFTECNRGPKSNHLPNTRLETFVFECSDIEAYHRIQKAQGTKFLSTEILRTENYSFLQTVSSPYTGNSVGVIQWHGEPGRFQDVSDRSLGWDLRKPPYPYLQDVGRLDHCATRIRARDRDAAIVEFMRLTNYHFDFAIYVKSQNSITNVSRLSQGEYAMVFTSGIAPYVSEEESGPTEKFIHNYNTRVHHMAFATEKIEQAFDELSRDGMDYLLELVGSEEEGLKQTFTVASPNTLLVNEYIHRYGDFDGFFTRSNVTLLTEATQKQ